MIYHHVSTSYLLMNFIHSFIHSFTSEMLQSDRFCPNHFKSWKSTKHIHYAGMLKHSAGFCSWFSSCVNNNNFKIIFGSGIRAVIMSSKCVVNINTSLYLSLTCIHLFLIAIKQIEMKWSQVRTSLIPKEILVPETAQKLQQKIKQRNNRNSWVIKVYKC